MAFFASYIPGGHKLNMSLFWEYDTKNFNPQDYPRLVVTRIVSLGGLEDWYAGFDLFGGIQGFAKIANDTVTEIEDKDLNFMCRALGLKKEETKCYKNKQSRKNFLNS